MEYFLGIAIVITIISNVIQYKYNDSDGFVEYLIDDFGWLNILICVVLSAIIAGFIFWSWLIMLIIMLALLVIGAIVAIIIYKKNNDDNEDYDEEIIERKSNFKCESCGAHLIRQEIETYDGLEVNYICEHCGISFDKSELNKNKKSNKKEINEEIDLTDFEEEYFENCLIMNFRPYNKHTISQIERKYDKLIDECEIDEDDLDSAYDYFCENLDEIDEYIENEKSIKERFEYYKEHLD